jgi:hypothetical protein
MRPRIAQMTKPCHALVQLVVHCDHRSMKTLRIKVKPNARASA